MVQILLRGGAVSAAAKGAHPSPKETSKETHRSSVNETHQLPKEMTKETIARLASLTRPLSKMGKSEESGTIRKSVTTCAVGETALQRRTGMDSVRGISIRNTIDATPARAGSDHTAAPARAVFSATPNRWKKREGGKGREVEREAHNTLSLLRFLFLCVCVVGGVACVCVVFLMIRQPPGVVGCRWGNVLFSFCCSLLRF